jgi:hypothetical protein
MPPLPPVAPGDQVGLAHLYFRRAVVGAGPTSRSVRGRVATTITTTCSVQGHGGGQDHDCREGGRDAYESAAHPATPSQVVSWFSTETFH